MSILQHFSWVLMLGIVFPQGWSGNKRSADPPTILVFSKTDGFTHGSIPAGNEALIELGLDNGFEVDTTQSAEVFTEGDLASYAAVVFLNTTGDVLNKAQQGAFERYMEKGGGYVGIHSATDTEFDWEWYGKLVGAYFKDHPAVQEADLYIQNPNHPATEGLPEQWTITDEWYNFRDIQKDIHVLITIDEDSYKGGGNGEWHPISWFKEHGKGRVFYTGLGHRPEIYQDPLFLKHLLGGISYAVYGDDTLLKE